MDSAHEELQSLRRSPAHFDQESSVRKGFFDFAKKSFSTNSSPIKEKIITATHNNNGDDTNVYEEKENDNDDYDFDTDRLEFDPFNSHTEVEAPVANSTILLNVDKKKKRKHYRPKSVRFENWENILDESQLKILKNKLKQFEKIRQPIFRRINTTQHSNASERKDRVSSSEYSVTPDTTEVSELQDQSAALTDTQKLFLLPKEVTKKSQLKRSDLYTPLTDLTKTPRLVKSLTDPIVSNSADQNNILPKCKGITTEESAKDDCDVSSSKSIIPLKLKTQQKHQISQKLDFPNIQSSTIIDHQLNLTPNYLDQRAKQNLAEDLDDTKLSMKHMREKPFSLRLEKLEGRKLQSAGSNEESYDQVDILEQSPPQLPDVSHPNPTCVFERPNSTHKNAADPCFEHINKLETFEFCSIELEPGAQVQIRQIIEALSHASNTPVVIEKSQINNAEEFCERIRKIKDLTEICDRKIDKLNIQVIKLNKQISDHEWSIKDKEHSRRVLQQKLNDVLDELDGLKLVCSKFESKRASQTQFITLERQANEEHKRELSKLKKSLGQCQANLEDKELHVENITLLVGDHYPDEQLDLCDETQTLEALKELLSTLNQLSDKSKNSDKVEISLKEEISALVDETCALKIENADLKKLLKVSEDQATDSKSVIEKKDMVLQDLKLENENYGNLLKSLECTYFDLKNQLENEKFRTKELEGKIHELEIEKITQDKKTSEMDKILKDQLSLVNDAQNEIDNQASSIAALNEESNKVKCVNAELITAGEAHKTEIKRLEMSLAGVKTLNENLNKSKEELQRHFNRSARAKDEELLNFKRKVSELQLVEGNLANELKETRARLSNKFSQCSMFEKKVGNLNYSLKESNENCRVLRSEILKNNGLRLELRRTLVGLSIGIIRNLDGIIDNDSLSTVREDLNNEDENREFEKLHDISLFIEEAVGLIIKEHWSLTKRLSESQKGSLYNGSLGALQQIIEGQNDRLKQLQAKLHYYEEIFKKINKANSRSSSSTSRCPDVRIIRPQVRDSTHSIEIGQTVRDSALREKKDDEINRLLSKVKGVGNTKGESTGDV